MKHWLKIDNMTNIKEEMYLLNCLDKYNKEHVCKITFWSDDLFNTWIELECEQDYNELDLPCNSLDLSFERASKKSKKHLQKIFLNFEQYLNAIMECYIETVQREYNV